VIILKKIKGNIEVSILCTIVVIPVDLNCTFHHKRKKMMKITESKEPLAKEQYGSK